MTPGGLSDAQAPDLPSAVAKLEKHLIARALEACHWHRGQAAAKLNIDRKTLYAKIGKYGLLASSRPQSRQTL